jgi:hypothetical protein
MGSTNPTFGGLIDIPQQFIVDGYLQNMPVKWCVLPVTVGPA